MWQHEHEARCLEILGQPFSEIHQFMDQFFPRYRDYSHRVILHHLQGVALVKKRFGRAAGQAALLHLKDDCPNGIIPADPQAYLSDPQFHPWGVAEMMLEKDLRRMLGIRMSFDGYTYL